MAMAARWWYLIGGLIMLLSWTQGKKTDNFTVSGQIILPVTGDYRAIPEKSCIRLVVMEGYMCSGEFCDIPVLGTSVIRDIQVTNNTVAYKVNCITGGGYYALSVTFNVGWCGVDSDAGMKKGDYHNEYSVTFPVTDVSSIRKDVSITYYDHESLAPAVIEKPTERTSAEMFVMGSIVLPTKGIYTDVPKGSCLQLDVKEAIQCEFDCVIPTLASLKFNVTTITDGIIQYKLSVDHLKSSVYTISALLNIGWCSDVKKSSDEWLKYGDYFNDISYEFHFDKNGGNNIQKDIAVREYKKYLCGDKQCYHTETCISESNRTSCSCPPYACADYIGPLPWVCANDGRSYSSECWMNSEDCFAGTIKKEYSGQCVNKTTDYKVGKVGRHIVDNSSTVSNIIIVMITVATVTVLSIVVAVIVDCGKKALKRRGTLSKDPIVVENSFYEKKQHLEGDHIEPIYAEIKEIEKPRKRAENIYVGVPRPRVQPKRDDSEVVEIPVARHEQVMESTKNVCDGEQQQHARPQYTECPESPPPPYDENARMKMVFVPGSSIA